MTSFARVPAALVEALRKSVAAWGNDTIRGDSGLLDAARAVVAAAERPDEGEERQSFWPPLNDRREVASPAPVGEPLCECGHTREAHGYELTPCPDPNCRRETWCRDKACPCSVFTPAREVAIPTLSEDEAEQIAKACWQGVALPQLFTAVESILAARLRGNHDE